MSQGRPESLLDAETLGTRHPHGTRIRYSGGCRCLPCRAANANYETARAAARRAGQSNRIVHASPARRHLRSLSRSGVGYKTVARIAGVGKSILCGVKTGRRSRCREETIRKVLAVKPRHARPGAYVDARRTWDLIHRMLERGGKKAWIARAIGKRNGALQLGRRRVTKRNADAVERLYRFAVLRKEDRP